MSKAARSATFTTVILVGIALQAQFGWQAYAEAVVMVVAAMFYAGMDARQEERRR